MASARGNGSPSAIDGRARASPCSMSRGSARTASRDGPPGTRMRPPRQSSVARSSGTHAQPAVRLRMRHRRSRWPQPVAAHHAASRRAVEPVAARTTRRPRRPLAAVGLAGSTVDRHSEAGTRPHCTRCTLRRRRRLVFPRAHGWHRPSTLGYRAGLARLARARLGRRAGSQPQPAPSGSGGGLADT